MTADPYFTQLGGFSALVCDPPAEAVDPGDVSDAPHLASGPSCVPPPAADDFEADAAHLTLLVNEVLHGGVVGSAWFKRQAEKGLGLYVQGGAGACVSVLLHSTTVATYAPDQLDAAVRHFLRLR